MPVRLGISPIGWSNDDLPELGGDIPLHRCLAEAQTAGYEGIELGHKFPRDPAALWHILEQFGLVLISGWYSGRLLERPVRVEIAAIEAHSSLLAAMGCAVLVYAETSGSIAGDRRRPASIRPHSFGGTGIASGMSIAGMSGARCWRGSAPATRAFSTPRSTVCLPCRATAASIFRLCSPNLRQRTTTAGWLSRPNGIPQKRRRSLMRGLVLPTCVPPRRAGVAREEQ
jgi:hypothetical protein